MEKNRIDLFHVLSLRQRLSDLLSSRGVLAKFPFRRLPALRALLVFLDAMPLDTPDALAFAGPMPPAVIGGVALPLTEKDDGISIPAALISYQLSPDTWDPAEELETRLATEAAQAAIIMGSNSSSNWLPDPLSASALSAPASPNFASPKQSPLVINGVSPNPAIVAASSLFHTSSQQPAQQLPFSLFASAVASVEVETAWRVVQGACVISPSQHAQCADERLFEAAMAHTRHALSISPMIEREFLRAQVVPSGATAHQLGVLRVALAALPAVEVVMRRSVAALRLALSSGFVSFLFSSVLGNTNCCKCLRTAALDLICTTLWDCHYCVPRGVVSLLGGGVHQSSSSSASAAALQQQSNNNHNNAPLSAKAASRPTSARVPAGEMLDPSSSAAAAASLSSPLTSNNINNNNPSQQPATTIAALEATVSDLEIASAVSALVTVVRAELVLLEKHNTSGNVVVVANNNNNNNSSSGQTVDDLLFSLIHLRDPSGISYWTSPAPNSAPLAVAQQQQHQQQQNSPAGAGVDHHQHHQAASAENNNNTAASAPVTVPGGQLLGNTMTEGSDVNFNASNSGNGAAGGITGVGENSALESTAHTASPINVAGSGAADALGSSHITNNAFPLPGTAMPTLRLGGLSFLHSIATNSGSARVEAGAFERSLASLSRRQGAGGGADILGAFALGTSSPSAAAVNAAGVPSVALSQLRGAMAAAGGVGGVAGGPPLADSARRAHPMNSSRQPALSNNNNNNNNNPSIAASGAAALGGDSHSPFGSGVGALPSQQNTSRQSMMMQQQQQLDNFSLVGTNGQLLQHPLQRTEYFSRAAAAAAASAVAGPRGAPHAAPPHMAMMVMEEKARNVDMLLSALQKN